MSDRLADKVALVTGGGAGIGKAICRRFSEEGAAVVVTDIDEDAAKAVAESICSGGGKALALYQDVTEESGWHCVIDKSVRSYGYIDVLVNNAGIGILGNIETVTMKDWRKTHAVNLDGVYLGIQAITKVMKHRGGSIINISSVEGIVGEPQTPAYNSSKGAVRILTKSVALYFAESDYDIRVNSVHPGPIATDLIKNASASMSAAEAERFSDRIKAQVPLKRYGTPREIANGCLFLASDESSYMTGSELVIDGGLTAR